jgi:hypothetical protein
MAHVENHQYRVQKHTNSNETHFHGELYMSSSHEHVSNIRPFDVVDLLLVKRQSCQLYHATCPLWSYQEQLPFPLASLDNTRDPGRSPRRNNPRILAARLCDRQHQSHNKVPAEFALLAGCSKHLHHFGSADSTTSNLFAWYAGLLVVGLPTARDIRVTDFVGF